jgi:ribosome modulation factor
VARKLKAEAAPKPQDGPAPDVLKKHFRDIASAQADVKKATGELGPLVKKAEEEGVHKKAMMDALKLQKMDAAKRGDFWRALTKYVGPSVLNLFSQADLFAGESQAKANATTAPDTDDADKRNAIAEEQGYQAGLAAHAPETCSFPPDDPAKPFWQKGWRRGQNENALKFKADKPAEATTKPADVEMPAFLDRTKAAAAPTAEPEKRRPGRPRKGEIPPVATHSDGNAFH